MLIRRRPAPTRSLARSATDSHRGPVSNEAESEFTQELTELLKRRKSFVARRGNVPDVNEWVAGQPPCRGGFSGEWEVGVLFCWVNFGDF